VRFNRAEDDSPCIGQKRARIALFRPVIVEALAFLRPLELLSTESVCKSWRAILREHDQVWRISYVSWYLGATDHTRRRQQLREDSTEGLLGSLLTRARKRWRDLIVWRSMAEAMRYKPGDPRVCQRVNITKESLTNGTFTDDTTANSSMAKKMFLRRLMLLTRGDDIKNAADVFENDNDRPCMAHGVRKLQPLQHTHRLLAHAREQAPRQNDHDRCVEEKRLRRSSQIAYFECLVEEASVGLVSESSVFNARDHVGWRSASVGYHSDDGGLYFNLRGAERGDEESEDEFFNFMDPGPEYGEKLSFGEPFGKAHPSVVGCGVDFATSTVFFTLEGKLVGARTFHRKSLETARLPAVSIHRKGGLCALLRCSSHFLFDIDGYVLRRLNCRGNDRAGKESLSVSTAAAENSNRGRP